MKAPSDLREIDWKTARRFVIFWGVLTAFAILCLIMYQTLLVPIGISLFLSFLLSPPVSALGRQQIPRPLVVSLLLALTLGLIAIAGIKVIPALYSEISRLIGLMPQAYDKFIKTWLPSLRSWALQLDLISAEEFDSLISGGKNLSYLPDRIDHALRTLWATAPRLIGLIIHLALIPMLTFFLLKDYETIKIRVRELIPRDLERPVMLFLGRVSGSLREVLKGQAMVAGILSVLYVAGLSATGLQGAVAIGLLAGICRLIPYLDVVVGGFLSLTVIMSDFQGAGLLLAVSGVFLVVQCLDGMIITPRIIGEKVGLHPVLVIVSIIAFGELFGFWGVLLAIPGIAVARVTWHSAKPFYLASAAYDPMPAAGASPPGSEQN